MSVSPSSLIPPPGPPKKEANANVIVALIGAGGAILAASIPIVSSHLNRPSAPPAVAGSRSASGGGTTEGKQSESEIPSAALADKTDYYVTLYPYRRDGGADSATPVQDAYFRSPKDAKKWMKLTVMQHSHNQVVTLTADDYRSESRTADIDANKFSENDKSHLDTGQFKLTATVVETKTGADPDKTAPLDGKVFEKLLLRVSVEDKT